MTYFDSSALVSVYVPEPFSANARIEAREARQIPFTALHQLEVPNAFEVLAGRRAITAEEHRWVLQQLQDDLRSQRLMSFALDLEQVFADAADLSRRHSARFLARSLDLLHVASAHLALCSRFVSGDDRQLRVAKAAGLTTIDVKRPIRTAPACPLRAAHRHRGRPAALGPRLIWRGVHEGGGCRKGVARWLMFWLRS